MKNHKTNLNKNSGSTEGIILTSDIWLSSNNDPKFIWNAKPSIWIPREVFDLVIKLAKRAGCEVSASKICGVSHRVLREHDCEVEMQPDCEVSREDSERLSDALSAVMETDCPELMLLAERSHSFKKPSLLIKTMIDFLRLGGFRIFDGAELPDWQNLAITERDLFKSIIFMSAEAPHLSVPTPSDLTEYPLPPPPPPCSMPSSQKFPKRTIDKSLRSCDWDAVYSKRIRELLEIAEAFGGDSPRYTYFRKSVLRCINDLKRELIELLWFNERLPDDSI